MSDRRALLQLALGLAGSVWLPRSAWSQPRLQSDPFALGVASGSPQHDSVVLWTRLLSLPDNRPVTVHWELADDPQFRRIVQRGQAQALVELAHSVHVEPVGLAPDRWYFYRFMCGDAVSPVGRTRTAPAPDAEVARLRLAYASCQRWEHGYFSAWRHLRDENVDAVMFLGDYIYEYPGAINSVRPLSGGWVWTLEDYRQRHALYKSDPDLQAMHAACPWLFGWDDHEVQNDYAGLQAGDSGMAEPFSALIDFRQRRADAYQAYYEHMPLRARALTQAFSGLRSGAEMRLYQQLNWGRLVSMYQLDTRQYRDPQVCSGLLRQGGGAMVNPADCAAWQDPSRSMLGAAQEQWLDRSLARQARSDKLWTVLGQAGLFGQRDAHPGVGESFWNDGWDGYAGARRRLTDSLRRHAVANPVILGGDVHENWVGQIKSDYARPASPALGVEFCGTSISSRARGEKQLAARLAENPHFAFADARHRGYGVAEFTPRQLSTTLRVVDDARRPDAAVRSLARFVVPAGRALLERTD